MRGVLQQTRVWFARSEVVESDDAQGPATEPIVGELVDEQRDAVSLLVDRTERREINPRPVFPVAEHGHLANRAEQIEESVEYAERIGAINDIA
jgi:hypothetical protein